jgi:hypothetical protein
MRPASLDTRGRHRIPLPAERREQIGFVLDRVRRQIIAPWGRKKGSADDEARMDAMLDALDAAELPADVCWCWPDRPPEPVTGAAPGWLAAWSRDRAVYKVAE